MQKIFMSSFYNFQGQAFVPRPLYLRVGWSHQGTKSQGYAVFRIGIGKKHINIFKGPRLW